MLYLTDRLGVFLGKKNTGKTLSDFLENKEEKRENGLAPSGVFGLVASLRGLQAVLPGVSVPGLRQN